ncbi:unnamed protein product [Peronospora belbahrii]|uniref:Uncharacterized protein n=1 Tax=Peronospora belbahrii TaxID=622444 RepID=A0AAU9L3B3_9STRA|nr:unnamed protein product [Peronospora belbahrii]CAH0522235.1 unnamed protein product [Peronospora belbahrii]
MTMSRELQEAIDGFFLAAEYGRSDVIKALADHSRGRLSLGDVVDPVTGRSPLHVAVANGKKDALRVLLSSGFPPDHQSKKKQQEDNRNLSAYGLAQDLQAQDLLLVFHQFLIQQVAANNVNSVNQLLVAGVDVSITDATTGGSLLHWAVSCQAVDVMKDLLEKEDVKKLKLVDARNREGATPLHLACHANNVECVTILLAHHADVNVKGDEGFSKNKTASELTTKPEIMELFSRRCEECSSNDTISLVDDDIGNKSNVKKNEGKFCLSAAAACEQEGPMACIHKIQSGKLLLQLEEKDLLVNQLKTTIETLVQELQEVQMLGEERVMLDYVRKLRDEKMTIQRQLEDADDYINDQQQQLNSLKEQIRQMSTVGSKFETDHDILSHTSDGTTSSNAGCPPDNIETKLGVSGLHQLEKHLDEEYTGPTRNSQAEALKLDAWTSTAQRKQTTFHQYAQTHGSDTWSAVWHDIWTGTSQMTHDEDEEIIMTV